MNLPICKIWRGSRICAWVCTCGLSLRGLYIAVTTVSAAIYNMWFFTTRGRALCPPHMVSGQVLTMVDSICPLRQVNLCRSQEGDRERMEQGGCYGDVTKGSSISHILTPFTSLIHFPGLMQCCASYRVGTDPS